MLSSLTIIPLTRALKWLVWLTLVLVLLIGSVANFYYTESQTNTARAEKWNRIQQDTLSKDLSKKAISVANLTATPKKYHNQRVWVKGYLNLEFEGDNIYWRQIDYRAHNYRNALWVNFTDSLLQTKRVADYSKHYVVIEGVFEGGPGGHGSINPGTIDNITSINALQKGVK